MVGLGAILSKLVHCVLDLLTETAQGLPFDVGVQGTVTGYRVRGRGYRYGVWVQVGLEVVIGAGVGAIVGSEVSLAVRY